MILWLIKRKEYEVGDCNTSKLMIDDSMAGAAMMTLTRQLRDQQIDSIFLMMVTIVVNSDDDGGDDGGGDGGDDGDGDYCELRGI